ncbi:MAG: regulatory protein LuxR [Bacteroidetes bacterium]|nr:regulatory protein LuxR [Bacteroidota bacterium]
MRYIVCILSLLFVLSSCRHSSQQNAVLLSKADKIMEQSPDSALLWLKKIQQPKELLSSKDFALYSLLLSQAYDKNDIEIRSDSLIQRAVDYFSNKKDYTRLGYAFFYLSRSERNKGNAQGQAEALLKALSVAIQSNNFELIGLIYSEKASIYEEQNQLDSMISYSQLSYNALKKGKNIRNQNIALMKIGYGYYLSYNFKKALSYYKNAENTAKSIHDSPLLSSIYSIISLSHYYQNDYREALLYARKSLNYSDVYDFGKWTSISAIYIKLGEIDSAKLYLNKCLQGGNKTPDCYLLLQEIAEKEKNYSQAIAYSKQYATQKDSLFKQSLATSFAGMEKKYNYERIAAENKSLIIVNQRNKIAVLFLLLGFSCIIVIVLLWRYRHKQIQLKQHQELVEKEKENNLLLQQQINMQNALIKNVEHHKRTAIKRLVPNSVDFSTASEDTASDSLVLYDELISSIDGLYNGFSQRLKSNFPQLTTTDILICCLLRAGFESGMIASVLDTQTDSFNVRRTRLRKKLKIRHGINFSDFLAEF